MPNAHTLKTLAQQVADSTGTAFVVFEAYNAGGSQNWGNTFPSLVGDQIVMVAASEGNAAIQYDDFEAAAAAFSTLAREATENYTAIIGGEIHLVASDYRAKFFEIDSKTYPVLENGEWRDELAPNRL